MKACDAAYLLEQQGEKKGVREEDACFVHGPVRSSLIHTIT